ncbi:uncharacterized protein LOC114756617 [Neltuma alba]|uniref:uncharacterized protein LOC114756617 n=1 Tax=Neltuma alba TaxID=207710 RepID=UPI0010A330EA|nr:uncharacterized protein LOC114756617 [Prosopis alba]XP_028801397.1 uncharacterized protein LOC114756617 [Prosopis alba]
MSLETLPRQISYANSGASDRRNGFTAAPADPRVDDKPKKVTQISLMEASPEDPCSPPPTSLLGIASVASNAPIRKRPTADKMLAKAILYSDDEIFQKFIEDLRIDVTLAAAEAKRVRQMHVLMSLRYKLTRLREEGRQVTVSWISME